jgi:hypothetical protein
MPIDLRKASKNEKKKEREKESLFHIDAGLKPKKEE